MKLRGSNSIAVLVLALAGTLIAGSFLPTTAHSCHRCPGGEKPLLPIVYVHGGSGSAAQYEHQAQRWASNDYPNLVTALDRVDESIQPVNEQMDEFFDAVLAKTGEDQLFVLSHSFGSLLMKEYLNSSPERSAKVAKFISIDSASAGANPECPGNPEPVDCIGIYRDDNPDNYMGPVTYRLPLHGHTQCVTSAESFAIQHEYFTGRKPWTTLVLPEPPGQVEISGRAVYFPANTGVGDSTLEIWEIDGDTGARKRRFPRAVIEIGEDGAFGPVRVNGSKHYEFALFRPDIDIITHYYFQPFLRDDHLVRLLASPAGSSTWTYTAMGPDHSALVILRYFEWWNDQEVGNDTLWVTGTSPAWDDDPDNPTPPPLNILSDPLVAPRSSNKLGIHAHDENEDKVSSLERIFPFYLGAFQTSADIWMPATEPPDGTITFTSEPRGDSTLPQGISVPNWASEDHRVLVQFNTYFQDIDSWRECWRHRPSPCNPIWRWWRRYRH